MPDFPTAVPDIPDAAPTERLRTLHGGLGHAAGTNRMLVNLRELATKLGLGSGAGPSGPGVLRRSANEQSAWDLLRAGDYAAASVADADLAAGIDILKLSHVGAGNVIRSSGGVSAAGPIQGADIAPGQAAVTLQVATITSATNFINFLTIPQTFRSLRLECTLLGTAAINIYVRFGAADTVVDGAAAYDWQYLLGYNNANKAAAESLAQSGGIWIANCYAGQVGSAHCVIPNYSGSTYYHWLLSQTAFRVGGAAGMYAGFSVGQWRNAGPIRCVQLFTNGSNFAANGGTAILSAIP